MGNSRTSRFADGRDLYHVDAVTQELLRALARQRPRASAADVVPVVPARLMRAARESVVPAAVSVRRLSGEVARLLMANGPGRVIRDLARRHRMDEGDVARVWAQTVFRPMDAVRPLPTGGEAEPA